MTDNEIQKALENQLEKAIDYINSQARIIGELQAKNLVQQAEIERLQKLLDGAEICIDELEYALDKVGHSNSRVDDALEKYNNLVKEMVGGNNV